MYNMNYLYINSSSVFYTGKIIYLTKTVQHKLNVLLKLFKLHIQYSADKGKLFKILSTHLIKF